MKLHKSTTERGEIISAQKSPHLQERPHLQGRREFALGLFRGLSDALQSHDVFLQVDSLIFLELFYEMIDQSVVEILASQQGVAVGGFDLKVEIDQIV